MPGTRGAQSPFWSPDGRSIGFFADGELKKKSLEGGPPQVLAPAPRGYNAAWSASGAILYDDWGSHHLMIEPRVCWARAGASPDDRSRRDSHSPGLR